jgi:hypothetical protein
MRAQESLVLSKSFNTLCLGILCHLIHLKLAFFEHSAVERIQYFVIRKNEKKIDPCIFFNMEPAQIIAKNVAFRVYNVYG